MKLFKLNIVVGEGHYIFLADHVLRAMSFEHAKDIVINGKLKEAFSKLDALGEKKRKLHLYRLGDRIDAGVLTVEEEKSFDI